MPLPNKKRPHLMVRFWRRGLRFLALVFSPTYVLLKKMMLRQEAADARLAKVDAHLAKIEKRIAAISTMEAVGDNKLSEYIKTVEVAGDNKFSGYIKMALNRAILEEGKLNDDIFAIDGMSGRKYRIFINNLIGAIDDARYLEIGTWQGSTLCSAIFDNKVYAMAIDNWSQFGGPYEQFSNNLARFNGPSAVVTFLEADFRQVDFSSIGKFNVYLFDGPHKRVDQRDGVLLVLPALDNQFVIIVDDWNFDFVRLGTYDGLKKAGLSLDYIVEIRTSTDNTQPECRGKASDWHNGYFIAACSKPSGA